jgi:hypothetical protein
MDENSIFPDTAAAASVDLASIGPAAEAAARVAEGAFQSADLSMSPDQLGQPGAMGGLPGLEGLQGLTPVGTFSSRGGDVGGGDLTVNLVVDGQVLAKTVIKNTPRALAASGLNQRQR